MPRFCVCLLVGIVVAAHAKHAQAQVDEPTVMLEWSSEEGCLDTEALIAAVTEAQPRNAIVRTRGDATIRVAAERNDSGTWSVLFVVLDAEGAQLGERHLVVGSATCAALKNNVVVVSAMLVDSTLRGLAAPSPQSSPDQPPVKSAPAAALAVPPPRLQEAPGSSTSAEPEHQAMRLSAGASGDANRLPSTSLGVHLALGWRVTQEVELAIRASLHPSALVIAVAGESTISWRTLTLIGCHSLWHRSGLEFAGCAGLRLGVMGARGRGFARNREPAEAAVDAQIEVLGRRNLGEGLFVAVALAGYLALIRPRFGYEDSSGSFETIHAPSAFALGGTIALGVNFF